MNAETVREAAGPHHRDDSGHYEAGSEIIEAKSFSQAKPA
jgi:hypothetical protein